MRNGANLKLNWRRAVFFQRAAVSGDESSTFLQGILVLEQRGDLRFRVPCVVLAQVFVIHFAIPLRAKIRKIIRCTG
jgi:hypothetical protein